MFNSNKFVSVPTSSTPEVPYFESPVVAAADHFGGFPQELGGHYLPGMAGQCVLQKKQYFQSTPSESSNERYAAFRSKDRTLSDYIPMRTRRIAMGVLWRRLI